MALTNEELLTVQRSQRMFRLEFIRAELRRSKITYTDIAVMTAKAPGTIGRALRGGFPYDGGAHLPAYLEDHLAWRGILARADAALAKQKAMESV